MEQTDPPSDGSDSAKEPAPAPAPADATALAAHPSEPVHEAELEDEPDEPELPAMTIGEHLDELRKRLMYSIAGVAILMVVCLIFGKDILKFIEFPYNTAIESLPQKPGEHLDRLAIFSVTGGFTLYLKIATYTALVAASPWVFYQLWMFVAAGLYDKERRYVSYSIPVSVGLFLLGAAFAFQIAIYAIKFFVSFNQEIGTAPFITMDYYLDFMTDLVLLFGLVFQTPLVVLVLARIGIVNMKRLNHYRRHVIVGIAVLAAVFAPPDVVSMALMAVPMWLLYEIGVILSYFLILRKRQAQEAAEGFTDEDDDS